MDAIRTQVIVPLAGQRQATGADAVASGSDSADRVLEKPVPLISDGAAASRLAAQLELLRQRQGLNPGYHIKSHRLLTGWFINSIKRLIHWGARPYTDLLRERQEALNETTLQALREASLALEHQARQVETLRRQLGETRMDLLIRQEEVEHALHALHALPRINVQFGQIDERLTRLENQLAETVQRVDRHDARHDLGRFFAQTPPERRLAVIDQNRGTYDDIEGRQRRYVELFRDAPGQVLDVGCGRGELLGLLRQAGIEGWGAEIDPLMIGQARARGLHVIQADALAALDATPAGSLGGLFAAQVVEHLFPGELLAFLRLAREHLAPGGRLVIETLNPASLGVLAKSYYRDLDHKQPIHPEYLRILIELAGFEEAELHAITPFRDDESLPALPPAAELGLTEAARLNLQERFDRLNGLLFGMQDYFITARPGALPATVAGMNDAQGAGQ